MDDTLTQVDLAWVVAAGASLPGMHGQSKLAGPHLKFASRLSNVQGTNRSIPRADVAEVGVRGFR